MTPAHGSATWVMPHWTSDFGRSRRHLEAAVRSVFDQSDAGWELVVVDDGSDDPLALAYLHTLAERWPQRVHVIVEPRNLGAGAARNVGVRWAAARGSPFVLFLDADDLSRPGRLAAVRAAFADASAPGVVYSTFDVIDPAGRLVPLTSMTGSVAEVIEAHRNGPPQGSEVWIAIGTETGYVNHTSSTAVRTEIALAHPFPNERVSEDAHTWLRYAGSGALFAYLDKPWSAYRTTTDEAGSSSRAREGGKAGFYAAKARVDADGFRSAIELAAARGAVVPTAVPELWVGFHVRLAATLAREGQPVLALEQVAAARAVSIEATERRLAARGWSDQPWACTDD
jgi:glycosyltransferase involved in cell wall biosynthesis